MTVYMILKRIDLINGFDKPNKQRIYRSFSRNHPDSLWQTDIKVYEGRYLVAYIDDCSRYVLDAILMDKATTGNIINHLKGLFEFRKPGRSLRITVHNIGPGMEGLNSTYPVKRIM